MEYVFIALVGSLWIAAGCIGALVALRNLKADWGDDFKLRRPKKQ